MRDLPNISNDEQGIWATCFFLEDDKLNSTTEILSLFNGKKKFVASIGSYLVYYLIKVCQTTCRLNRWIECWLDN